MSAEAIAKALGGRKAGGAWMAHCPAHDDREPSLTIRDGTAKCWCDAMRAASKRR
jgi:putative DNA primase/helicase